jgi:hypothetical protein
MSLKTKIVEFWRDESGFLPAIFGGIAAKLGAGAIGQAVASGVGGIINSRIGAAEDRRNARKDYEQQRKLGFTHSEIAGSGGAGASDTMTNVMGNQATQFEAQRRQMEYDNLQRDKDRAVALQGQATQLQAAQTAAAASNYSSDTQRELGWLLHDREAQKIANQWANDNPQLQLRLAQMRQGPDNMIADALAIKYQLLPSDVANISRRELQKRLSGFLTEFAMRSGSARNVLGDVGGNVVEPLNFIFGTRPSDVGLNAPVIPAPVMPEYRSGQPSVLGNINPPG